jgi:hypothetical protein
MKTYHNYTDPGHGWLRVTKKELELLGVADKISSCSYMRGDVAFLEEDCDDPLFLQAQKVLTVIKDHYSNKFSKIRNYDSYVCYTIEEKQLINQLKSSMFSIKNWNRKALNQIKCASLDKLKYWQTIYNF